MNGALFTLGLALLVLLVLDLTALRYGANSRRPDDDRPDWW